MRIGIFGMPMAGKTFLLEVAKKQYGWNVFSRNEMLQEILLDISTHCNMDQAYAEKIARKMLAMKLQKEDDFLIDGYYSSDSELVFLRDDINVYDVFVYLYVDIDILRHRLGNSEKEKYQQYAMWPSACLQGWQDADIDNLRYICNKYNKKFFVLGYPAEGKEMDINAYCDFLFALKNRNYVQNTAAVNDGNTLTNSDCFQSYA